MQFDQSLLLAVLDTAVDGIILIDERGVILMYNPACEKVFGYTPDEAIGNNVKLLMPPPYRDEHDGYIASYRSTGEAKIIGTGREVTGRHKSGRTFPMELSVGEARQGDKRQFVGVVRDITERKRAEKALARRAEDLSRSNSELEQFAYAASHDLKAPLRAIENLATWIAEDLGDALTADSRENMHLLRGRIKRMEALLDELLEYARAGRGDSTVEVVDTTKEVREIGAMVDPASSFQVLVPAPLPVFATHKTPFEQVLRNLIGNAVKHHDRDTGRVEVVASTSGEFYEFAIADDGPGIPPEYHGKIWQMFQTLKSRDVVEGSGMGLAVVKKLVERHRGSVSVQSGDGRGTTIRFTWPRWPAPAAEAE